MQRPSESTSFTSIGTLQADDRSTSFDSETNNQFSALAKAVLAQAQLLSPTITGEGPSNEILDTTGSSSMTATTFLTQSLPTPDTTPTKAAKRSYIEAFNNDTFAPPPIKYQATSATLTSPTPSTSPRTPTKRNIFNNIPAFSVAHKSLNATASTTPQRTHLPSPPLPVSPPTLQELQDELAEPLISDVFPSPGASAYTFRQPGPQAYTSTLVIDQDESGTYDPNKEEEEEEEEEEEVVEVNEPADEIDDDASLQTSRPVTHGRKSAGIRLSTIEYKRFLKSLLEQVSFSRVDRDVASNRGTKVFRRVIKEMFRERIEEAGGR